MASLATAVKSKLRREVLVDYQSEPCIVGQPVMCTNQLGQTLSWMDPIIEFFKNGSLADDPKENLKVRRKATRFWLSSEGKLYQWSYSGPYL